jgi:hypothetical protein
MRAMCVSVFCGSGEQRRTIIDAARASLNRAARRPENHGRKSGSIRWNCTWQESEAQPKDRTEVRVPLLCSRVSADSITCSAGGTRQCAYRAESEKRNPYFPGVALLRRDTCFRRMNGDSGPGADGTGPLLTFLLQCRPCEETGGRCRTGNHVRRKGLR